MNDTFKTFIEALGPLMAEGLNKKKLSDQLAIAEQIEQGATLYTVATFTPAYVVGYLRPVGGTGDIEVFRVASEEAATWTHH